MAKQLTGVYPGTFDPPTAGHLDIIGRALKIVDRLVIGVAVNIGKGPLFTLDERVDLVRESLKELGDGGIDRVDVRPFDSLLMHFTVACGATVIVRGLRAVSDFEYEFQMTGMNARLNDEVETVFLMASEGTQFVSSRLVKEICGLGGDVSAFVPQYVNDALVARLGANRQAEKSEA